MIYNKQMKQEYYFKNLKKFRKKFIFKFYNFKYYI